MFLFPLGWHKNVYVHAEDSYTTPQVGLCDFYIPINCNMSKLASNISKLLYVYLLV